MKKLVCSDKYCGCDGFHECNCEAQSLSECKCFKCQSRGCDYKGPKVYIMNDDSMLCETHADEKRLNPKYILDYNAGARKSTKARSTGTTVTVYNAEEANLDSDDGAWSTICENHGGIVAHERFVDAVRFSSHPEEWCEDCRQLVENGG